MSTSEKMMYGWNTVPWRKMERNVYKLQKRIYQASRRGDVKAIHKLQRLLMNSRSAAFLAVRRVAQDNKGKKTAGIDGLASLRKRKKLQLAQKILSKPYMSKAKPVRRVWIPKPGKDEQRPLGIPVMEDRARQALAKMALEPEWEAKFEPTSFGFRPGRSCHDAVETIYRYMRTVPKYVLDADIAGCFDHINHKALLDKLGTFPSLRRTVRAWLKAGIFDSGTLFPTTEGTPQGGVISPLLANIALHGLSTTVEGAFQIKKYPNGRYEKPIRWKPVVIRYADDFVILHPDLDALKRAEQIAAEWLKGMGLEMKPSKTRITHTLQEVGGNVGFDFLGFNFRQYHRGKTRCIKNTNGEPVGFTISVRPSSKSQKQLLRKIREIVRSNPSISQPTLIGLLNPVIRGWGNYFSSVVSKDIFGKMDTHIYQKLWAWAKRRHPNKNRHWIAHKYWSFGERNWLFGRKGVATLHKLSDIPIRRHIVVQKHRSPYDGDAIYWGIRMGRHPEMPRSFAWLLKVQRGCCPCCGLSFKPGDQMVVWRPRGQTIGQIGKARLLHEHCQQLPI
jgi:RNA-directed DNA polymerase